MIKKILLLSLFTFVNLSPFRVVSADESDPCMGEDPVSPVLIHYYNEFTQQTASTVDYGDIQHSFDIELTPGKSSLAKYYSEFLE